MLVYLLYGLFFISCVILIVSVLLQPGKTDAGALFTSNISSTAFGPRGTTTILSKITIAAAAVFFISALLLAMPAITGNISVLQTTSGNTETSAPAATDANANTAANADANANANAATNPADNPVNTNAATNTNAAASNANSAATAPANANVNQ
jgi:preprotein translocase subunit SecG